MVDIWEKKEEQGRAESMGAVVIERPYKAGPGRLYTVWLYPEDKGKSQAVLI